MSFYSHASNTYPGQVARAIDLPKYPVHLIVTVEGKEDVEKCLKLLKPMIDKEKEIIKNLPPPTPLDMFR